MPPLPADETAGSALAADPPATPAPLPALLSQPLVAFIVELDNEFEHQMRHRTTRCFATPGSAGGPWLASHVMWSTCMRYVDEDGVTIAELDRLARTGTNLDGMRRWGYISIEPDPRKAGRRPPRRDAVLRATAAGLAARETWEPLEDVVEQRWRARFGDVELDRLRTTLWEVTTGLDPELPDCLPILGHGLWCTGPASRHERLGSRAERLSATGMGVGDTAPPRQELPLSTLLSRVLFAFATAYERQSDLSLAIGANALSVLDESGVRVKDLPLLSGVSKESIAMAMGVLQKGGFVAIEAAGGPGRSKLARLTGKGRKAKEKHHKLLGMVEESWRQAFGRDEIINLRRSLASFTSDRDGRSLLFEGLKPYPDGWRSTVPPPGTLPHFPMVLHRGGYPDGS